MSIIKAMSARTAASPEVFPSPRGLIRRNKFGRSFREYRAGNKQTANIPRVLRGLLAACPEEDV